MNRPQTIQIFLPDGSPRSVKIAEMTNRVVQAIFIPRNKLDYVGERNEVRSVGLYFLFGESNESVKPIVYIGEAEDCYKRLKQHNREKDFWNYAVAITSKTNSFTKSHVKYLEHHSIKIAKEVNRFYTENSTTPTKPFITESMEADLLDSFDTIKVLLSTLGYPLFESVDKKNIKKSEVLQIKGRGIIAEGDLIDDGFVIFKGSQAKKETTTSCHEYLITIRNKLRETGIIAESGEVLVFNEDYVFNSPSTAGGVILGRSTNGWTQWKDKNGITLDKLKRK